MSWNEMRAMRMRKEDMMHDFMDDPEEAYECGYEDGYKDAMKKVHSGSGRHYRDEDGHSGRYAERRGWEIYEHDRDDFGERRRRSNGRFY